ncbi:uncharacterized protein TNCV_3971601 [Trichonephila clavipes]|nr:uncharacterized protein TNCV_3971601 [Trichonephila clavipes]
MAIKITSVAERKEHKTHASTKILVSVLAPLTSEQPVIVGNVVNEFNKCGIEAHNPLVFNEHDFAASKATDHDVVGDEIENNSANHQTLVVENQHINPPEEPEHMTNADYYALKKPVSVFISKHCLKQHNVRKEKAKKRAQTLLQAHPSNKYGDRFNSCQVIYSQFGLAIHQNDHQARRRFVEWAQNEIAVVPDFHKRILFSNEAHFWLNGYVNKQNCRIWSEANPQVYVETPLHPEKLTVWCALWAGGILLQKR